MISKIRDSCRRDTDILHRIIIAQLRTIFTIPTPFIHHHFAYHVANIIFCRPINKQTYLPIQFFADSLTTKTTSHHEKFSFHSQTIH